MESVRLFLAVELPEGVRRLIGEKTDGLRQAAGEKSRLVKWVPAANLHITVKFLGQALLDKIPGLHKLLDEALGGFEPFSLEAYGTGAFPGGRSPRVLWVGARGPFYEKMLAVKEGAEAACEKAGFERETNSFTPHITIGRVRPDGLKDRAAAARLMDGLATLHDFSFGMIDVEKITLMKSVLKPGGPEYSALAAVNFGGRGQGRK